MKRRFIAPSVLALAAVLVAPGWWSLSSSTASPAVSGPSPKAKPALIRLTESAAPAAVTLNGAGANSIAPFFTKVFYDYEQLHSRVTVNYSPAGSSVGIKDIQENTVGFGDSEIPMSSAGQAEATGGTVLQVPVELGGVALSYNVPGAPKGLHLDAPTLASIFDGAITHWNDPAIAKVSGVSNLPVGSSKASTSWPLPDIGEGEQLNTGVATFIKTTPGAIGYVSFGYASKAGFANAALKNASGSFVVPSSYTIGLAGAQAAHLSASNFSIIDEPGTSTYPLANFSWTLLYKKQPDAAKGSALGELFYYVVTAGQKQAKSLGYSPLPANVALLAKTTLTELRSSAGVALFKL